jgi:squalene-hopene/tetraprenyl-beta-curcumene cyclase
VRALLAAGVPAHDEGVRHGVDWLLSAQQPDGRWPAGQICMHIRDLAYYVDGLIVDGLALAALGRYRIALDAARSTSGRGA